MKVKKTMQKISMFFTFVVSLAMPAAFAVEKAKEPKPATTTKAHPQLEPQWVIEQFLTLDAKGIRFKKELKERGKILPLTTWGAGLNWDFYVVIEKYSIGKITFVEERKARVEVTYKILGRAMHNSFFPSEPWEEKIVYELAQQRGIWKISGDEIAPHILKQNAPTPLVVPEASPSPIEED